MSSEFGLPLVARATLAIQASINDTMGKYFTGSKMDWQSPTRNVVHFAFLPFYFHFPAVQAGTSVETSNRRYAQLTSSTIETAKAATITQATTSAAASEPETM